jgi:hypothetical protein
VKYSIAPTRKQTAATIPPVVTRIARRAVSVSPNRANQADVAVSSVIDSTPVNPANRSNIIGPTKYRTTPNATRTFDRPSLTPDA